MFAFSHRLSLPVLLILAFPFAVVPATSQEGLSKSGDGLWTSVSPERTHELASSPLAAAGQKQGPVNYRLFELDIAAIKQVLGRASLEDSASLAPSDRTEISIPLPNGTFQRFAIVQTQVFEPELAAKFPEHKAYRGRSVEGQPADLALEISPKGMFAQIRSVNGTVVVHPFPNAGQDNLFTSSDKKDFRRGQIGKRCLVLQQDQDSLQPLQRASRSPSFGGGLRVYRLAIAATGEYTRFHGGTVADAMGAIQTTVNRTNQIYEAELSIRFRLVGQNDKLLFTEPNTDPFNNDNADVLIEQSQTVIDREIGEGNYDVGHTFSTGAGGLAQIRSAAKRGAKAKGVTGSQQPRGDPYDVDYVAHEIGHQFGANHTFNGTRKSCGGGNRNAATAFEPGGGVTILAYAGICGSDDIQPNSNAFFHFASLDEISGFVANDPDQPAPVATGNRPPDLRVGPAVVIPKRTPFRLGASATDPDGDVVTFAWEEEDLGPAQGLAGADNGRSPLFRSFPPTPHGHRTFPRLVDILAGKATSGELLPNTSRPLLFRVTVRDNKSGGGAFSGEQLKLTVTANAGPFRVTAPAASSTVSGYLLVTWDVARTDQPPVRVKFVNIRLSLDGGQTFDHILSSNTPNDGRELVQLPTGLSGAAMRVKVEAADNIFFAISPGNFEISPFTHTFVVVRHAEPDPALRTNDPGLSSKGKARAIELSNLLFRYGHLNEVFSTRFRRAIETAQRSSDRIPNPTNPSEKVAVSIYESLPQLSTVVKSRPAGSRMLIVGHSNSIADILKILGPGSRATTIPDSDHDNLFIVVTGSTTRVTRLRYTADGQVLPR